MAATRYWARMARLKALEAFHTGKLRVALVRQAEAAAAMLETLPSLSPMGIQTVAALVNDRWLLDPLRTLYVAAGLPEANDTYDYLLTHTKALAPVPVKTGWASRLRNFITTEGAAAVRGITDATRNVVRKVLNESAAAGDGIQVAATKLRAKVAALAPERARRIVRTELLTAANYGSLLGAQATGLSTLEKFWIATPGPRTRPEHQAANKQAASLQGGFFTVGGEQCRYPGDPLLSAGMRVNCRCSIGYRRRE